MKPVVAAVFMCLTLCSLAFGQEEQNNDKATDAPSGSTTVENNQASGNLSPTKNTMSEPSAKPMVFTLRKVDDGQCPTCRWISAEGNIVSDTPSQFTHFLEENKLDDPLSTKNGLLVSFHSDGGDILAAIALGREIRKHNFDTTIAETIDKPVNVIKVENQNPEKSPDQNSEKEGNENNNSGLAANTIKSTPERIEGICREACLWAFLGGHARNVGNGKLELRTYRPPLDGAGTSSGQEVSVRQQQLADIAYIADYSQEMGFDPLIAFLNWDNANSHVFSAEEIRIYNIDFSPDVIGKWQLAPTEDALVAIAISNDKKTSARLYCDSHKTTFLEISGPTRFTAENFQNYQQAVSTFKIWGMPVAIGQMQMNLSEGRVVYTIELPKTSLQDWHVDVPYLKGENVPETLDGIANVEFSDMPGLKQAARFVMANCPSSLR